MKIATHSILIMAMMTGCREQMKPDCGTCQATPTQTLNNAIAVYNKSAVRVLNPDNLIQTNLYVTYCNPDFIAGKVSEGDTIYISGALHPPCNTDLMLQFPVNPQLTVTAVKKK